jgi:hypothetical protein
LIDRRSTDNIYFDVREAKLLVVVVVFVVVVVVGVVGGGGGVVVVFVVGVVVVPRVASRVDRDSGTY